MQIGQSWDLHWTSALGVPSRRGVLGHDRYEYVPRVLSIFYNH